MNCSKCSAEVRVVPAGISKKTGKAYGSFYKCDSCQNSVQIGAQPPRQATQPNGADSAKLDKIIANQAYMLGRIEELITIMTEPDEPVKVAQDETGF